ncbi:MAG TPA: transglutaminase family protein [Candidatus Baltobacteraceae bacterium]|nr:transglutaminase family protein [Candidatus Baltobacteraceae bacterium]
MSRHGRRVVRASYVLHQQFRYAYPGPIDDLHHRLVVAPPDVYGDQRRVSHRLRVSPKVAVGWDFDPFGNWTANLTAPRLDGTLLLDYEAHIERTARSATAMAPYWAGDPRYVAPSALTEPDEALRAAARALLDEGTPHARLAERINAFVFRHMKYVSGTTSVATTAAQAFAQGTGVCQDYAHVMLALCRLCGVPARYVSGHLIGEGGTHAWLEAVEGDPLSGEPVATGFDPTHDRCVNLDYVFVAAGRDYADVAPTSGRFVAPYVGRFTTSRRVDVVDVEYAA